VDRLSLAELSEQAGLPPRTIRFYIARNLLPGPLRSGRSAQYGDEHLRLLKRIKKMQTLGMTLTQVALALKGGVHRDLAEPVAWLEYELAEDVVVRVRGGVTPWRHKVIRSVLSEAAAKLQDDQEEKKEE
jgi:DNA-binding transcriptional MerR regulator